MLPLTQRIAEGRSSFLWAVEVAGGHIGTVDPDFSDNAILHLGASFRIHNGEVLMRHALAIGGVGNGVFGFILDDGATCS